jgi:hypothetical protein
VADPLVAQADSGELALQALRNGVIGDWECAKPTFREDDFTGVIQKHPEIT